jgi:excisionase family DNA binding protein
MKMETELLTIAQFCQAVNCGRTRAYQLINKKQVVAIKNGKKTLIPKAEMLKWIASLQPYKT